MSDVDTWLAAHIGRLGGTLFGLFGLSALAIAWIARQEAAEIRRIARNMGSYTEVPGEVIESRVMEQRSKTGYVSYAPVIRYRFEHAGKSYTSARILPQPMLGWPERERAQEWVEAYPVGQAVSVYVDPECPTDCLLERQGEQSVPQAQGADVMSLALLLLALGLLGYMGWLWTQPVPQPMVSPALSSEESH